MCNAWNHPIGCTCGWGGEGHMGGGHSSGSSYKFQDKSIHLFRNFYDSYLNPNAKCPVCGAPVFFYQSPFGGRVFFDELGPPWPKHPCTSEHYDEITFIQGRPTKPNWKIEGWIPALYVIFHNRKGKHLIAFALLDDDKNPIIEAYNYSAKVLTLINDSDFIFYRPIDEFLFEIKCYNILANTEETFTFKKRKISQNIFYSP